MSEQLELIFDCDHHYTLRWDFRKRGLSDARDITIGLLQEAIEGRRSWPITFLDIARRKLQLPDDSDFPGYRLDAGKDILDQLRDDHLKLKEVLELSGYSLVCVNEDGESSLGGGGRPTVGFRLRDSQAGVNQDLHSLKMHSGAVRKIATRLGKAGALQVETERRKILDGLPKIEEVL